MTKRSFTDLVATWANIFKSIPADQLEDLTRVEDLWSEGTEGRHANPTRAEIKTGRPQEASGAGAERMVREFSHPVPQMGLTESYSEFSRMFRDFGKSLDDLTGVAKTQAAQIAALASLVAPQTTPATVTAASPTAKAAAEDSVLAKAEIKLKKARAELRKADMADDEDKDEREEKKSFLEQAAVALKAAKRLLTKAEDEDKSEEDEERAEKARADFAKLSKALRKAEDDDKKWDEDEAEKALKAAEAIKAAAAAAAAPTKKADDDKKEETTEEKALAAKALADAATAKAAADATAAKGQPVPIDQSVRDQVQVLSTSVKGLMEIVMAGSRTGPMPTFSKSMPVATMMEKVDAAIEDGTLDSPQEIMKAQTLMTHIRAVQDGRMDAAIVDDEIAQAPDNVRTLFQPAQAAA